MMSPTSHEGTSEDERQDGCLDGVGVLDEEAEGHDGGDADDDRQ